MSDSGLSRRLDAKVGGSALLAECRAHFATRLGVPEECGQYEVTKQDIARFRASLGYPVSYKSDSDRGLRAPQLFYLVPRFATTSLLSNCEVRPDGTALAGVGYPGVRVLAGSTKVKYGVAMWAGDRVQVDRTVTAVEEKTGSSGLFLLVTFEHTLTNHHDEEIAMETYSVIIRDGESR